MKKGLEKLYSKPWARFLLKKKAKIIRKIRLINRTINAREDY